VRRNCCVFARASLPRVGVLRCQDKKRHRLFSSIETVDAMKCTPSCSEERSRGCLTS
jgi:hypothetical protein